MPHDSISTCQKGLLCMKRIVGLTENDPVEVYEIHQKEFDPNGKPEYHWTTYHCVIVTDGEIARESEEKLEFTEKENAVKLAEGTSRLRKKP